MSVLLNLKKCKKRKTNKLSQQRKTTLYKPLGVGKSIEAAYKKLSRLYHPDKHIDERKKQQALLMFSK